MSGAFDFSRVAPMEDQHRDKRQKMDIAGHDFMEGESTKMPTNHNRKPNNHESGSAPVPSGDNADLDIKSQVIGKDRSSTQDPIHENLWEDMGGAFLPCKSSKTLISPVLSIFRSNRMVNLLRDSYTTLAA